MPQHTARFGGVTKEPSEVALQTAGSIVANFSLIQTQAPIIPMHVEEKDRSVDGGTFRWGLVRSIRSYRANAKGTFGAILVSFPVALLSVFSSATIFVYLTSVLFLGINAGSLFRKYDFQINFDDLNIGVGRKHTSRSNRHKMFQVFFLLVCGGTFLIGTVVAISFAITSTVGLLIGAGTSLFLLIVEEYANREHDKSWTVAGIRIGKWILVNLPQTTSKDRMELGDLSQLAENLARTFLSNPGSADQVPG